MTNWKRVLLLCTLMGTALAPVSAALGATSVSGRASTVLEWHDDAQEDTAVPAYQYLLLNLRDIGDTGWNFSGYGRLADDLADETVVKSRLYHAYLEKKGLAKGLDFKLGRQFIATAAGASLMDGLKLDYGKLGPLSFSLFGGGDVSYYEGYNAKDLIDGVEVRGTFLENLNLSLSYLQKWEQSELTHELIGFDAEWDINNRLDLTHEIQYSWLSKEVTYLQLGARYHRSADWTLAAEYLYSLPVFSATSIYSVFAAEEYEEVSAEFTYRIKPGLQWFARYSHEIYDEYDNANVFELGIEKLRTGTCSGYLSGVYRNDPDGQDLKGFKLRGAYLFNKYIQAGAGLHLDVAERRLEENDETTSTRVWVDLTAYLSKKISVDAILERVDSDLWDYYNRGRVRLNVLF